MRKTDKKIDNRLRIALTDVCETALKEIIGFRWLTHLVNYSNFPKSLKIICIFDTAENLTAFISGSRKEALISLINNTLQTIDIDIKNITTHISFDTEEACKKRT